MKPISRSCSRSRDEECHNWQHLRGFTCVRSMKTSSFRSSRAAEVDWPDQIFHQHYGVMVVVEYYTSRASPSQVRERDGGEYPPCACIRKRPRAGDGGGGERRGGGCLGRLLGALGRPPPPLFIGGQVGWGAGQGANPSRPHLLLWKPWPIKAHGVAPKWAAPINQYN